MSRFHATDPLDPERIRERLCTTVAEPRRADEATWQAATALVVAPGPGGAEIAFIRRTERQGDRWSGDMALPGGHHDHDDVDLAATAARECREEVGIDPGEPVTRLPDQIGRSTGGCIATFVHVLDRRPPLDPDPREVAEALWIPWSTLNDPRALVHIRNLRVPMRGIDHEGRVIWGLTHRILETFAEAIGTRLPA